MATPLGPDKVIPVALHGREALSSPFEFSVSATADSELDASRLLGQPAVVTLTRELGSDQHFHGFVRSVELQGYDSVDSAYSYHLSLVPEFWLLTRRTDCRIFQEKSVPDIIEEVFHDFNIVNYSLKLTSDYKPRNYCVQYRESSFAFLSRLMEEEGIYYYFTHTDKNHSIVLSDSPVGLLPYKGGALNYRRPGMEAEADTLTDWSESTDLTSGRVAYTDWNYETPMMDLSAETSVSGAPAGAADLEAFEYPGRYDDRGGGERRARIRAEAEEAHRRLATVESNAPGLRAGCTFSLADHGLQSANTEYTAVAVTHDATNNLGGAGAGYRGHVRMIRHETPFRPYPKIPRPRVDGLQTAVVVGPPGAEVHTDKLGRVKVRFHWDRRGRNDANASCWLRVAQGTAGAGWGSQWLPRIGMEVVVGFIDGDPDRPLVNGVVYNGNNTPPHSLPDKALVSSWRSMSSPKGGGFNELTFDDNKDQEQVFLHAQKRMDLRVGGASLEAVGGDRHLIVSGDRLSRIDGDDHREIKGDLIAKTKGDIAKTVNGNVETVIDGDMIADIGGEIVFNARSAITLRVGGSQVRITASDVALLGAMIRLNSGGSGGDRSASPAEPKNPDTAAVSSAGQGSQTPPPKKLAALAAQRSTVAQAAAFRQAAQSGTAFVQSCPNCK